ncbi:MAG TPA: MmgE/PrpD family protein [Dehalococcoidia bacterium]|nr:MmgE/PrpD family protein [Dehalococcoidia bacterium]
MADEVYNPLPSLIDFATRLRYEDLPANVVHETKRRIVDSLGTAIGGLNDERLRERRAFFTKRLITYDGGGAAYGLDGRLSLPDAAFLNSTMTRWLDYNDTYLALEPAHPSDNLGLLFAIAGAKSLSGRDLITAAALAYDVQCRFTEAASLRARGWDHVNYILISAALAGARLLGFDKQQMYNAVAFALSSHGAMRQAREGSYLSEQKNMAAGDAVRGAAWALEKVLSGSHGPAEIVEGKHGFVNQLSGPLDPAAFDDLGGRFLIADTYIKQHVVEYHSQTVVDHALALREKLGNPALNEIKDVLIRGYEAQLTIIGDESKRHPTTKETADHSLYFAFAATMLEGEMTLRQYRPEMLTNPDVLALIQRIRFEEVPQWTEAYFAPAAERQFASSAAASLRDGRSAVHAENFPHGHPHNPMTDAEIEAKFAALTQPFLADQRAVLDAFWAIDEAPDVAALLSKVTLKGV